MLLTNKRVLITGGTGSLGRALIKRILDNELGSPESLTCFSRDEAKQHALRQVVADKRLKFRLGDVADYHAVVTALTDIDICIAAAALKHVVPAEYFPLAAIHTNIIGAENLVKAICDLQLPVTDVVFVSTDKATAPVTLYGMTKAVAERVFVSANLECPVRFVGVRYGNVMASRGSILPLWHDQIRKGGPVTVTSPKMTRFMMTLDDAVTTIFTALTEAHRGEIYVPLMPSANIGDLASVLIGNRDISTKIIGVRPGEKLHESLISEEEASRTVRRGEYWAIAPTLPELQIGEPGEPFPAHEFSSADGLLTRDELAMLISNHNLMVEDEPVFQ